MEAYKNSKKKEALSHEVEEEDYSGSSNYSHEMSFIAQEKKIYILQENVATFIYLEAYWAIKGDVEAVETVVQKLERGVDCHKNEKRVVKEKDEDKVLFTL